MKFKSGYTSKTKENILINAGVLFKNFVVGTDTFEKAIEEGKLLGDTNGGSTFKAVANFFEIETDGAPSNTKGLTHIDFWDVSLDTNLAEMTEENLVLALGAANAEDSEDDKYIVISGKDDVEDSDYVDNITIIGTITGSNEPVIIQIFNALCKDGLELKTEKKKGTVITAKFTGHYTEEDVNTPPYKIYYPKQQSTLGV